MDTSFVSFVLSALMVLCGIMGFVVIGSRIRKEQEQIARDWESGEEKEEKGQSVFPYLVVLVAFLVVLFVFFYLVYGGLWEALRKGIEVMGVLGVGLVSNVRPVQLRTGHIRWELVEKVWNYLTSTNGIKMFFFFDTHKEQPMSYLWHQLCHKGQHGADLINFHTTGSELEGSINFQMANGKEVVWKIIMASLGDEPDVEPMLYQLGWDGVVGTELESLGADSETGTK